MPRRKHSPSAAVDISVTVPAGVSPVTLRRWSLRARRRLPRLRGRVSVVTIDPAVSRKLNRLYRGLDRPTNILSFVQTTEVTDRVGSAGRHLTESTCGEIVLCPAVIRREARQQARAYRSYLKFILEHGFIHLLGLDHRTPGEERRWRRWERRLGTP